MNWQQRMKHEAGCEHWAWGGESCTCHRDEFVAAIEGVVGALREISESRGCIVRRSQELGGESKDYMDGCEIAYDRCADVADAALDRLNALNNPNEPKGI